MFKRNLIKALIGIQSALVLSCGKTQFAVATDTESLATDALYQATFKASTSEAQFTQPNSQENKTSIAFQVQGPTGDLIEQLSKLNLKVTENGVPLPDFTLNKNSVSFKKTVDILFAVDVTGSMAPTIESAKKRLVDFIKNTRQQGYHTRMCLSTFGDYTVQKCTRFYDNDPKDPTTQTQVDELISEISKLKALKGSEDPGGKDLDENPMRAVIDAALAPWGNDSQRFMILVTDAGFLYSPGNAGAVGPIAPIYSDVLAAIQNSKMKIFAVTPSKAGYNQNFSGSPSIVKASEGEWFRYSDLVNGVITLNTVLNSILSQVNTTFYVDYTVTSQTPGLDPSLPLSQRHITIELLNLSIGVLKGQIVTSNLPDGRVPDQKKFAVSPKKLHPQKTKVYVDGVLKTKGYKFVEGGSVEFDQAQPAGAVIKVLYEYESLKDTINFKPILFNVPFDQVSRLKVYVNGMLASAAHYDLVVIDQNTASIIFNDAVFLKDPYGIESKRSLDVIVRY